MIFKQLFGYFFQKVHIRGLTENKRTSTKHVKRGDDPPKKKAHIDKT